MSKLLAIDFAIQCGLVVVSILLVLGVREYTFWHGFSIGMVLGLGRAHGSIMNIVYEKQLAKGQPCETKST